VRRFVRPAGQKGLPDSTGNARGGAGTMLIAFALFLVFKSEGRFTRDLRGNAFTDMLVYNADRWNGLMKWLGQARIQPAVREVLERVRAIRW